VKKRFTVGAEANQSTQFFGPRLVLDLAKGWNFWLATLEAIHPPGTTGSPTKRPPGVDKCPESRPLDERRLRIVDR
jgi:hypothetical protein